MTKIYLIRHAEAEGNLYRIAQGHEDGKLTRRGWDQVRALSRRFTPIHIDAVYSSDLYRTRATASAIYKPKGLPLRQDPTLREANLGAWEGRPWGDISREEPENLVNFSIRTHLWRVEGGETAAQTQKRLYEAVKRIGKAHDSEAIAIVSHGFAIRMLLGKLQGYPLEKIGESPQEDNTAVSLLELEDEELRVVYRSDNSHLASLSRKRPSTLEHGMHYRQCSAEEARELCPAAADDLFSLLGFNGKEEPSGLLQMGDIGRIKTLYIRPEERCQGLGVQLIGQAAQRTLAQSGATLSLSLKKDSPAMNFFTENDFRPAGQTDDGSLILEKDLRCSSEF